MSDIKNAAIFGIGFGAFHFGLHALGFGVPEVTVGVIIGYVIFHEANEKFKIVKG